MSLESHALQTILESHFEMLSKKRAQTGHRVFAFEHCLSTEQVQSLGALLNESLSSGELSNQIWLCWVVYAAEVGYAYDGDEFWESFRAAVPRWLLYENRPRIRNWFRRFHDNYLGVQPTGAWARHFSIIAWPISHAILPRDLQGQLARALHYARYQLTGQTTASTEGVGRLIAATPYDASSRFRFFLAQEQLVGQIVLALLHHQQADQLLLYPPTLERIVADLHAVRRHRDWLFDAIESYEAPPGFVARAISHKQKSSIPTVAKSQEFRFRPAISAQRDRAGIWSLFVTFPPAPTLAHPDASYGDFLRRSRVRLPLCGSTWQPSGWLLSASRRKRLTEFLPSGVLLEFEHESPYGALLRDECILPSDGIWAFSIDNEEVATFRHGNSLSPGKRYLLLATADLRTTLPLERVVLECKNAFAAILLLPHEVDDSLRDRVKQLGFSVSRAITIEPAGFVPRSWDGLTGEWLTTEEPILALTKDHEFDAYEVILNDMPPSTCAAPSGRAYLRLGPLEPGSHQLSIRTLKYTSTRVHRVMAQTTLRLEIRHPRPWVPGAFSPAGVRVQVSPLDPSLDDLLKGALVLNVEGPAGRRVAIHLAADRLRYPQFEPLKLLERNLPLLASDWDGALGRLAAIDLDSRAFPWVNCYLSIDIEHLGEQRIGLASQLGPMRWSLRRTTAYIGLRLVNAGEWSDVTVDFFQFRSPLSADRMPAKSLEATSPPDSPGGLYLASRFGEEPVGIAIANPKGSGLQILQCPLQLESLRQRVPESNLIRTLAFWRQARTCDAISELWRNRVVSAIDQKLYGDLCGPYWARLQGRVRDTPSDTRAWQALEGAVDDAPSLATALGAALRSNFAADSTFSARDFVRVCERLGPITAAANSAWALATDPMSLARMPDPDLDRVVTELRQNKSLARAAKLAAMRIQYKGSRHAS